MIILACLITAAIAVYATFRVTRGVAGRRRAEEALSQSHDQLEQRIQQRTAELGKTNQALQAEITQRKRTEEELRVQTTALDAAANAIVITDYNGTIQSVNPAFTALTGYTAQEVVGQNPRILKSGKQDEAFYRNLWQTISSGQVWNGELTNRRKDGNLYVEEMTITPLRNADGVIARYIAIKQDITQRKRTEEALRERSQLAVLGADVGTALTRGGTLAEMLRGCSEAIVRQLDAAFARVWTLNARENMLELQASAGMYTHLNGLHGRVPVGKFKIGLIAEERKPHLTNQVVGDPRVGDQEWAKREGMVAFAGYPLVVDDRLVGVVAMFARHTLTDTTLEALASISKNIAVRIDQKQAEESLRKSEQKFQGLFESSRDAIMTTEPPSWRFTSGNPACLKMFRAKNEKQFISLGPGDASPERQPDGRASAGKAREMIETALREGSHSFEWTHRRLDGEEFPADVLLTRMEEGGKVMLQATVRDITERKRVEEVQTLLASVVQSSDDAIISGSLDGNILTWNQGAERVYGYAASEVIGKSVAILVPPDRLEEIRVILEKIHRGEHISHHETVRRTKDGRLIDVSLSVSPMRDASGILIGISTIARDITERKRAQETLRKSEERFQGLFESSRDAIMTLEPPSWRFTSGNPASLKMFRVKNEEQCMSLGPGELSPDRQPDGRASAEKAREMMETALREGSHFFEWTHRRLDGEEFPAEVLMTRMEQGGRVMLQGTVRDITERKKAERQLSIEYAISRIMAEFSTLEQTAPKVLQGFCETLGWDVGLLWRVDNREGLLRCSEIWSGPNLQADEFKTRTREMTIARGAGLAGRVWANDRPAWIRDIVGDADFLNAPLAALIAVRSAFAFPISIGSGVGAVIEFFSLAVREQDDALLRTCANIAVQLGQLFERKRAEDHLVQSQKMETVGKLAGGIAHEFNSIMTAIIGHSELLLIDLPPESPLCRNARQIRQAADRAAALTRQLLAYGRKQILQPAILDLNSILAGMENVLRHLAGNNGQVRITPGAGLKAVKADAGQIEQVIVNIAMNAAEAMPNGGTLSLETANVTLDETYVSRFPELKAGEYVMLAITDTGVGMSETVRTRVFEPFFSTKPVGQGTGLGLATCYGIVKQSGGHISVYSEPARGTTFKIYLPQVEAPAEIPVKRIDTPDLPRGTETILLVEDDPALREMAATLLTRLGYTVLTAANGVEALSLKQQRGAGHVDLLFTDVVMPHMNGKELSDRVRVLYPHTRILFTSAYAENSIVHQGVLDPGVALLQKPFTPGALARKVREVLDRDNLASAP
jgi:PAS domain S-box-containing protein